MSIPSTIMIPRYYQREATEAAIWGWEEHNTQLVELGTGAGKTFVSAKIFENFVPHAKCLFIGDQDELCIQPIRSITRATGIIPALEKAKQQASLMADIVVASSQSLSRKSRLERYPRDHFRKIIVDEAHRGVERDQKIIEYFCEAQVCGMTATPFRANVANLSKWYSAVSYSKPMMDLCEEGFAPPFRVIKCPIEIDLSTTRQKMTPDGKEFNGEDVDSTITPHLEAIVDFLVEWLAKNGERRGIAYLPLIKTSEAFAALLRSRGISAMHVDGTSHDRERILEGFAHGHFNWLCNAGLVSAGVDIPVADAFLNLQPMHSASTYQQRVGRIGRPLPGVIDDLTEKNQAAERRERIKFSAKPDAVIFDLLWQNERLSIMRPESLMARSEEEAKAMSEYIKKERSELELMEIRRRVQAEREARMVEALEKAAARLAMSENLSLEQGVAVIGRRDLLDYVPVQRWELEPPTPAQLDSLARMGINKETVPTKGHAKKIMDALMHRRNTGWATLKQIRMGLSLNEKLPEPDRIKDIHNLGFEAASREIDRVMTLRRGARLLQASGAR